MAVGRQVSGMTDLLVRLLSALAMAAVTALVLWLGGWVWTLFVALGAGIVLWEWNRLVRGFGLATTVEFAWLLSGLIYIGAAALTIVQLRLMFDMATVILVFLLPIIIVDIGAYFAGRTIGGPKIAPRISPSKTWAGLGGGAVAASLAVLYVEALDFVPGSPPGIAGGRVPIVILVGVAIAVLAQAGDFFESWMKRRAGVKDSSNLLPGHGGLFDRLDGLIAVYFVVFCVAVLPGFMG